MGIVFDFFFNDRIFEGLDLGGIDISGPGFKSKVSEFLWDGFFCGIGFDDGVFEGWKLDFRGFVEEANDFVEFVHGFVICNDFL